MPPPLDTAYADHAVDCWTWDTRGTRYLDFVAGLGPVILGHRYPDVENAVRHQLDRGTCFSLPTKLEGQLAERLRDLIPCAEMSRFLKNGADALEAAVRVARAVTGRDPVLRCGYHGMHDWCVESRGIPAAVKNLTVPITHGDLHDLERQLFTYHPAALVIEPVVAGHPVEPPPGYLAAAQALCARYGTFLVFDEVVTGFRMRMGGAQTQYGVTPDLACFSKAMANGYPISALCGRADLLRELERGVFVSTTFGGDAVGLAAALATLDVLEHEAVLPLLAGLGRELETTYADMAASAGVATRLLGYPQRWVAEFDDPAEGDRFHASLARSGILAPGYYNLMFAHWLHREQVVDLLTRAWADAFTVVRLAR